MMGIEKKRKIVQTLGHHPIPRKIQNIWLLRREQLVSGRARNVTRQKIGGTIELRVKTVRVAEQK